MSCCARRRRRRRRRDEETTEHDHDPEGRKEEEKEEGPLVGESLHGVLVCPLSGGFVVLGFVGAEDLGDFRNEGVVRVGVRQQRTDRQQDLADRQRRRPLVLQDVQTNAAVRVDVTVVNSRRERDLGGFEGVVGGEVYVQKEDPARVGRLVGAHDGRLPVEQVVADRPRAAVRRRIPAEVLELFVDALQSHRSSCVGYRRTHSGTSVGPWRQGEGTHRKWALNSPASRSSTSSRCW
mmetsp:Transcript_3472/g.10653  ORF Transcript_3472/g.10653 Transcript_3472/m.10653 type:complete len:236 (-) Transcript_3472:41-748(-)